jgi:hypothetical protein
MSASGTPFARNSLLEHIARGIVGIGALFLAMQISNSHPVTAMGLGAIMLLAFRGCPVCWTIGLVETIQQRSRQSSGRTDRASAPH